MNAEQIRIEDCPIKILHKNDNVFKDNNAANSKYHIDIRFDSEEEKESAAKGAEEISSRKVGMDEFPENIHSMMLRYLLNNGKYRDALLLVCSANLGMRFSDVVNLKVFHFVYSDGNFREKFYLSERKTGKERPFYVNEAVKAAVCIFWKNSPHKKFNDYLFTSESHNSTDKNGNIKPISHTAVENIIKKTLPQIGIKLKNDSSYIGGEIKLNTHSLRKMYGGVFCRTGCRLNEEGRLNVDLTVIQLLQNDYMHTSMSTTQRYCGEMERAKKVIVDEMNIGLPVLKEYL